MPGLHAGGAALAPTLVYRERWGQTEQSGPRHANVGFELTWVERGRARFVLGPRALEVEAGACVLIPPGIEHTPRGARAALHQLTFPVGLVEDAWAALGGVGTSPRDARTFGAHEPVSLLARLAAARGRAAGTDSAAFGALAEATLFALFGLVAGEPGNNRGLCDRRVKLAIHRMRDGFAEKMRIEDLAASVGMDRWAFARLFRAQTGGSPHQHLVGLRLDAAAGMLRQTGESVLEIALRCGYSDPSRFARRFRARYGCAPRVFRMRRGVCEGQPTGR
jgi:AraC-like DNA-binding protein